jgi:cbb3-type cytochrome oxidase subunit 3
MYKHLLKNQEGIQTLASVPLVLFFAVFVVAIVLFLIRNKKHNDRMANMPLEE